MAQTVTVQGEPEPIKKHVARRLIHRGWAVWVIRGVSVRRLNEREKPIRALCHRQRTSRIEPTTLPYAELPGLKVEYPKHRLRFVLGMTELTITADELQS